MDSYDKIINTELFEISTSEIFNRRIPKYFTQPAKGDLPVLNGRHVSWEEYLEARPDTERDPEFIPDMIYNPQEMNATISMEPVSVIIDYLDSDLDIAIANPAVAYPRIIKIMQGYLDLSQYYAAANPTLAAYLPKVESALKIIGACYERYLARKQFSLTGSAKLETEFDKIEKKFIGAN